MASGRRKWRTAQFYDVMERAGAAEPRLGPSAGRNELPRGKGILGRLSGIDGILAGNPANTAILLDAARVGLDESGVRGRFPASRKGRAETLHCASPTCRNPTCREVARFPLSRPALAIHAPLDDHHNSCTGSVWIT